MKYTLVVTLVVSMLITLVLFTALTNCRTPTKDIQSAIPAIPCIMWIYAAVHVLDIHSIVNGIGGTLLTYLIIFGVSIVSLAPHDFWSKTGICSEKIGRLTIPVLFIGGSPIIGHFVASLVYTELIPFESIVTTAIIPSVFEEVVFRGLLQDKLAKALGSNTGSIILTAFLFGMGHFWSYRLLYSSNLPLLLGIIIVSPMAAGVLFVSIKSFSGSTILSILLHFFYNATNVFYGNRTLIGIIPAFPLLSLGVVLWVLSEKE